MATNKSLQHIIRSKETLSGDSGTITPLTTDHHTRVSPIRSLNFVSVGIDGESLATNRFGSISDEHSLDLTNESDSLQDGRVFTAASGLHCHSDLKSDEDMEARSSSRELEDSSQDSFNGALRLDGIADITRSSSSSNLSNSPGTFSSKTSANTPHCRLRTALLTSTSRPSSLRMAPLEPLNCPSENQTCEGTMRSEDGDSFRRKSPGFTGGHHRLLTTVKDAIHSSNPSKSLFIQSNDQTTIIPSSVSPLSLSRPPSASSYVMRRMSTDSTVDHRPVSKLTKSISEPQSPEFHSRRTTLPVSPCRLPMKKRKLNWSQLDSDVSLTSPSTPRDLVHPASVPCSSFDFSFLNTPKTPSATPNAVISSSNPLTPTEPSSPFCSSGPSPLIIDCPTKSLPRGINVANHKKNAILESVRVTPLCSVSPRVDRRPRSIPAPLNSPLTPIGSLAPRKLEKNVFSSANNIPLSSDASYNSFDSTRRATLTPNVKNKDYSKRPSLLIRSLPAVSDSAHVTVAGDIPNSGLMSSQMVVGTIVSDSSAVANIQKGCPASPAQASFVQSRYDLMLPRGGYDISKSDGHPLTKNLADHTSVPTVVTSESDKPLLLVTTHSSVLGVNSTSTSLSSLNQNLAACGSYSATQFLSDLQQRIANGDLISDLPQLISRWLETCENIGSPVNSDPGSTVTSPAVTNSTPTACPVSSVSICPPASSCSEGVTQNAQIIMMLSPSNVTSHSESSKVSTTDVQSSKKTGSVASSNPKITNFPLFLVSASSSAGAAALAAATARATGAPPSSFVPVPVKITSYVPPSKGANGTASSTHSIGPSTTESVHHPFSGAPEQHIVISLCTSATTNHNSNELPTVERKSSLSSDSPFFVASLDESLLDSSTLNRNTGPKSFGIPLSHPPTAVAHPSA